MSEQKEEKQSRREKLLELQTLDGQIKQLEQQLMQIEEQVIEINTVIDSLIELKSVKKGNEILVPIANGIFIKSKIEDTNNLKVNVGSGVVVEKTLDETIDMLKEQIGSVESYKEEMFMQLQQLVNKASMIQAEVIGED